MFFPVYSVTYPNNNVSDKMDQMNDDAAAVDNGGRKRPEQQRYKPGAFKGKSEPGTHI